MKSIYLTIGVLSLAAMVTAARAQSFLTNGLVAYYPFNGNANDASGHGINATNNTATLTADRFGNANQAYSFNGANSYMGFANVPTAQTNNWTISSWIKPASLSQLGTVVSVGYDSGLSGANGFQTCVNSGNSGIAGGYFTAIYGGISTYNSGYAFTSTTNWTHIVLLRTNGVASFYVNGTQIGGTVSTTPHIPTAFTIGSCAGVRFFNGAIDDVRIYNRALTPTEVAQLYTIEAPSSLTIHKAVYVDTAALAVGTNYQLQVSSDLTNWTNQGAPFTASNNFWRSANYWDVENFNELFFRLLPQ
jgi:hypothetical protein